MGAAALELPCSSPLVRMPIGGRGIYVHPTTSGPPTWVPLCVAGRCAEGDEGVLLAGTRGDTRGKRRDPAADGGCSSGVEVESNASNRFRSLNRHEFSLPLCGTPKPGKPDYGVSRA